MIEISRIEIKGFDNLPPALRDTIMKALKCKCDGDEYDKIILKSKLTHVYLICRKCGLIKKFYENIKEVL